MPGTRVYLNLECENNRPVLYLRNISAESLNVRPEELTERFVRGDSSRSTEGSGLGLAIASEHGFRQAFSFHNLQPEIWGH